VLPGKTADATVLLPVVDRLRQRFHSLITVRPMTFRLAMR
jgi:hypothetical protein